MLTPAIRHACAASAVTSPAADKRRAAKPPAAEKPAPAPDGFRVTADGVFHVGEDSEARPVCSRLEIIARTHSAGLLVLDEIGMCAPRISGETIYMLGNGTGKARANDRGQAGHQVQEWRLLFLSTGEKTLAQHMAEAHKQLKAGMEVRLLAVPADAGKGPGLFEMLHGFTDAAALSDALKARVPWRPRWLSGARYAKFAAATPRRLGPVWPPS